MTYAMPTMMRDITPVLESVFVTHADNAQDITDIAVHGLGGWMWEALSYAELLDWTYEVAELGSFEATLALP